MAQLVRASPGKLMVVNSSPNPRVANFSLKNDCFGRVVLCCVAVALPFSASLGVIVHVDRPSYIFM